MRVAVSIGHRPGAEGYRLGYDSEYALMAPVAGFVVREIQRAGEQAWMIPAGKLDAKVRWVNGLSVDLAVEIHANADPDADLAGDPIARGAETLYHPRSVKGRACAEIVQREIVAELDIRNRGIKAGWYRGEQEGEILYWLRATRPPALIVEPVFLDNRFGMELLLKDPGRVGRAIARGILDCAEILE